MKEGRCVWSVKVSDKGQIAIPKDARKMFNIETGDTLLLFGDEKKGIAIAKADDYFEFAEAILKVKGDK